NAALKAGARLLVGGDAKLAPGLAEAFFVPPSVIEVDNTDTSIWQDEVFGPVLTVKRAESWEDCVRLANTTPYGLTASLFTNDLGKVVDALTQLEVGIIHINSETTGAEPHVPFGGLKASGY